MGTNAALQLLLAYHLELAIYGLLVTTIGAQLLVSRVLMLGMDRGMIRLCALPELRDRSRQVVQAGLAVILVATSVLVLGSLVVGVGLSPFVASEFWGWAVASVVGGSFGTALIDYVYGYRLARLEYRAAASVQASTGLVRLGLTVPPLLLFPQYPLIAFVSYPLASLLCGLAQTFVLTHRRRFRPERSLLWRLLRYSLSLGIADLLAVLSLYQGLFLLTLLGQQAHGGLYGLALTLSFAFIAVSTAFFDYIFPRMVSIENRKSLPRFLALSLAAAFAIAIACVPVILAIAAVLPWFIRPELLATKPLFYWLAGSMLMLILQCPLSAACQYLLRPHLVLLSIALRVVSIGILGFLLVPAEGALGAAVAQLGGSALVLVALAVLVAIELRPARLVRQIAV